MSDRPLLWVHALVKSSILLGFAVYIAVLARSDAILYYIAPHMVLYVKLAALGLYAVGAYQLYDTFRQFRGLPEACECGDDGHDHAPSRSWFKNAVFYGLFAFPLLLGFLLPDTSLGSAAAARKGMNLSSAAYLKTQDGTGRASGAIAEVASAAPQGRPAATRVPSLPEGAHAGIPTEADLSRLFPSGPHTAGFAKYAKQLFMEPVIRVPEDLYIETLTTLDLYADAFQGRSVELTGFVYRDETISGNRFVIGRFAVQCCSADASPYGLLVQSDQANVYPTDQWVKLTGTIGQTAQEGTNLLLIHAQRIRKVEVPKELYVSPNGEFGS